MNLMTGGTPISGNLQMKDPPNGGFPYASGGLGWSETHFVGPVPKHFPESMGLMGTLTWLVLILGVQ